MSAQADDLLQPDAPPEIWVYELHMDNIAMPVRGASTLAPPDFDKAVKAAKAAKSHVAWSNVVNDAPSGAIPKLRAITSGAFEAWHVRSHDWVPDTGE
jgi:hypothetical protein